MFVCRSILTSARASSPARRAGAERVVAFEAVEELATLAEENARVAGMSDRVTVLNAHSTRAATVASSDDPAERAAVDWRVTMDVDDGTRAGCRVLDFASPRADCVVSELMDTQLVGEGLLPSLRHAAATLLEPGYSCVPSSATVWAQVVQCEHFAAMGALRPIASEDLDGIRTHDEPDAVERTPPRFVRRGLVDCPGPPSHVDAHVGAMFAGGSIAEITAPFRALHLDFRRLPPPGEHAVVLDVPVIVSAPRERADEEEEDDDAADVGKTTPPRTADAVIFWWDCDLGPGGGDAIAGATISTGCTDGIRTGARDHWRQGVRPLPRPLAIPPDTTHLRVVVTHDDDDLRFRVGRGDARAPERPPPRDPSAPGFEPTTCPSASDAVPPRDPEGCTCVAHVLWGRDKVALWNNAAYRRCWAEGVAATLSDPKVSLGTCIDMSDGPLLAVLASRLGAPSVLCIESDHRGAVLSRALAHASGAGDAVHAVAVDRDEDEAASARMDEALEASARRAEEESERAADAAREARARAEASERHAVDAWRAHEHEARSIAGGETSIDRELVRAAARAAEARTGAEAMDAAARRAAEERARRRAHVRGRLKGAAAAALGSAPAWVFLAEPAFAPMDAQWADHCLALVWQQRRWARDAGLLVRDAASVPRGARVRVVPLECPELWRRYRPVGIVEGFDLSAFNRLWPQREEGAAFPVALSQLPHFPLACPVTALVVPLQGEAADDVATLTNRVTFAIAGCQSRGGRGASAGGRVAAGSVTCHALGLWVDFDPGGGGAWITTGPEGVTVQVEDTEERTMEAGGSTERRGKRKRTGRRGDDARTTVVETSSPPASLAETPPPPPYTCPTSFRQGLVLLPEPLTVGYGARAELTVEVSFNAEGGGSAITATRIIG